MLLEHERYYALGIDALVIESTGTLTLLWFGHGCCGYLMLLDHERSYGLGMDALVIVRTRLWSERSLNLKMHKPKQ